MNSSAYLKHALHHALLIDTEQHNFCKHAFSLRFKTRLLLVSRTNNSTTITNYCFCYVTFTELRRVTIVEIELFDHHNIVWICRNTGSNKTKAPWSDVVTFMNHPTNIKSLKSFSSNNTIWSGTIFTLNLFPSSWISIYILIISIILQDYILCSKFSSQ